MKVAEAHLGQSVYVCVKEHWFVPLCGTVRAIDTTSDRITVKFDVGEMIVLADYAEPVAPVTDDTLVRYSFPEAPCLASSHGLSPLFPDEPRQDHGLTAAELRDADAPGGWARLCSECIALALGEGWEERENAKAREQERKAVGALYARATGEAQP